MKEMTTPVLKGIVAMAPGRVIGRDGKLPWHLPGDLKFFREQTMGQIVVMGRKTFASIGKPLPKRENWVVSRHPVEVEGVRWVEGLEELAAAPTDQIVWIIGGATLYEQTLVFLQELLVTIVREAHQGDTWFPAFEDHFEVVAKIAEEEAYDIVRYRNLSPQPLTREALQEKSLQAWP